MSLETVCTTPRRYVPEVSEVSAKTRGFLRRRSIRQRPLTLPFRYLYVVDSEERIGQIGVEIEVVANRPFNLLDRALPLLIVVRNRGHCVVNSGGILEAVWRFFEVLHTDGLPDRGTHTA